jgi:two-component system, cell cycle response regulator
MGSEAILVVEDNPVYLKLLRILLTGEGYDVRTATDGEEALASLRTFHPRLILMDIQLPGMSGLELTQLIKSDAATREILIVALTAYAMKGYEEKALLAGCDGYLTKPLDIEPLPKIVATYLAKGKVQPIKPKLVATHLAKGKVQPRKGPPTGSPMGSHAILVVEDNPVYLKLLRILLTGEGYDVRTATDGEEALASLRTFHPRLILMDIQLPGMSGLELTQLLKSDTATREILIVALTAYAMKEKALLAGCDGYLTKPLDMEPLPKIVATYLARG